MGDFIEYQRFSSIDEAKILTDLLDVNQITFKVGHAALYFNVTETSTSLNNGIIIQTRKEDKERVEKLNQQNAEPSFVNDHYMYILPDNFLLEAVDNPLEWTKKEHLLAKQILKQRNIKQPEKNLIEKSK